MLVTIDYVLKWVEAMVASTNDAQVDTYSSTLVPLGILLVMKVNTCAPGF